MCVGPLGDKLSGRPCLGSLKPYLGLFTLHQWDRRPLQLRWGGGSELVLLLHTLTVGPVYLVVFWLTLLEVQLPQLPGPPRLPSMRFVERPLGRLFLPLLDTIG